MRKPDTLQRFGNRRPAPRHMPRNSTTTSASSSCFISLTSLTPSGEQPILPDAHNLPICPLSSSHVRELACILAHGRLPTNTLSTALKKLTSHLQVTPRLMMSATRCGLEGMASSRIRAGASLSAACSIPMLNKVLIITCFSCSGTYTGRAVAA